MKLFLQRCLLDIIQGHSSGMCDIWEQKSRFICLLSLLKTLMNMYYNAILLQGRLLI